VAIVLLICLECPAYVVWTTFTDRRDKAAMTAAATSYFDAWQAGKAAQAEEWICGSERAKPQIQRQLPYPGDDDLKSYRLTSATVHRTSDSPTTYSVEADLQYADGRNRQARLSVRWYADAHAPYYRVALIDVTDTRRAHLALRRVADEMRDLYQNAPCGYHAVDPDGVLVQINDTELGWLGYRREELVRKVAFSDLMTADCRDGFLRAFARLKERGRVRNVPIELKRKDGRSFPALLSPTAVTDVRGRFVESRASLFDITRRRRAEEEASRYATRLKAMAQRAAEVQETERRHLAQELHDRVGQSLSALSLNLNILKGQLGEAATPLARERLDDSLALLESTVESIRDVMAELRPALLDDYGLAAVLHWYAEEFSRRSGVAVSVIGTDPGPRLAPQVEGILFRIVQESLTNVVKHARARQVRVVLEDRPGSFCLRVADDGCGFDAPQVRGDHHHGFGLMIMRERAESAGARLTVESAPGRGTAVVIELRR
jgi:PAS domain S-box-containing protein